MNQHRKYRKDGYYDTFSGNIKTIGGDTIEVEHEFIIKELPDDLTNDDVVSVDNLGRLYRLPKTDIGGDISGPLVTTQDAISTWNSTDGTVLKDNPNALINSNGSLQCVGLFSISNLSPAANVYFNLTNNFLCTQTHYGFFRFNNSGGLEFITNEQGNDQTPGLPPNSFVGIWTMSSLSCLIKVPLRLDDAATITNSSVFAVFGQFNTIQKFDMSTIALNNSEDHILVRNNLTNVIEYRDASTIGGDILGPVSSVDNTIPRFDGITGKIIQDSGVIIDDSDNLIVPGTVEIQTTQTLPPEVNMNFVAGFTTGSGILKKQAKEDLFGQNLTIGSDVEFESVTADLVLRTDLILEKSLNSGVNIEQWFFKPQSVRSEAAININDPLRIDLKHLGDNDSILSVNGYTHDDNGIMFDMDKNDLGTADDMISSSVNANIFINKQLGALKFLVTNGIAKSGNFLKSTMNNVMEIGKTYINFNEPSFFSESVVMSNLPTSTANTTFLTVNNGTSEIQKQTLEPAKYDYSFFENNIVETTINIINVYERIVYAVPAQMGNGLFTIANNNGLEYTYIGSGAKMCINIDYNVYKAGNNDNLYQFELRLNDVKVGPSPKQKLENNTKWQMLSVNGTLPLTTNDVFTFFVRSETGTDNITVSQFTFNAFEIK